MAYGHLTPPWDRFVPFAQKIFVWAMVFVVLWLLRSFFFLVFVTFVFGYMLHHMVQWTEHRIPSRRVRVISSFLLLLGLLLGVGLWMGPALAQQAKEFPTQIEANLGKLDEYVARLRRRSPSVEQVLPDGVRARDILAQVLGLEGVAGSGESSPSSPQMSGSALADAAKGLRMASEGLAEAGRGDGPSEVEALRHATLGLEQAAAALGAALDEPRSGAELEDRGTDAWKSVLPKLIGAAQLSFSIGSAFLLSLLFSFLIVYDFPKLARGARHLHDTRLQFVYDEVSDSVFHFARVLGQALVAQLMSAVVNTALTVGDVDTMLLAIVFITVIHIIEAYVLNPRVYSAQLRMNPVLVLGILVISHHLVGLWGLILGVPLVNYLLRYVIDIKARQDSAAPTS